MESSTTDTSSNNSVRAKSRKNRVYVFRDFLWETYGRPGFREDSYLKPGDTVLDVAGGKGQLSWLFMNVDGLSSVVVDPLPVSSIQMIRSVAWLSEHPEEAQKRAIPNLPTHQPLARLLPEILERRERRRQDCQVDLDYLQPRHLKIKLNNDLVEAVRSAQKDIILSSQDECPSSWRSYWETLTQQSDGSRTNDYLTGDNLFLPESERKNISVTKPIRCALEAWNIIRSIKLITGFHPDQATEACLDLAAVLKVPTCIVPCCVFPSEFPDRKVRIQHDMVRVRNHELFIQYLEQKQPQLRKKLLNFHYTGTPLKNVALYSLPEDFE